MSPTVRAFIAVPVPPEIKASVTRRLEALRPGLPGVRWTRPAGWHLTLHFLGDVPTGTLHSLGEILAEAAGTVHPFRMSLDRFGSFPESGPARVAWIGSDRPVPVLEQLQTELGHRLRERSFRVDRRPFHPHLTLGRIRSPRDGRNAMEQLRSTEPLPEEPFPVEQVILYESRLRPSGAVYSEIASELLASQGESHVEPQHR